ncbi:hypothetical protein D9M68_661810 [compost metagenome]
MRIIAPGVDWREIELGVLEYIFLFQQFHQFGNTLVVVLIYIGTNDQGWLMLCKPFIIYNRFEVVEDNVEGVISLLGMPALVMIGGCTIQGNFKLIYFMIQQEVKKDFTFKAKPVGNDLCTIVQLLVTA